MRDRTLLGQLDAEHRAALRTLLDPDAAIMDLHHAPYDRQPDASTLHSRIETLKKLKDPFAVFLGDARSVVTEAQLDPGTKVPELDVDLEILFR